MAELVPSFILKLVTVSMFTKWVVFSEVVGCFIPGDTGGIWVFLKLAWDFVG